MTPAQQAAKRKYNRERSAKERAENPDAVRARNKRWRDKNPKWFKNQHLKRSYGLTLEAWEEKFNAQGGRCGGCQTNKSKVWHTDHNHETGAVRAILCINCNTILGVAHDNPALLRLLADYLEHHNV